MYSDTHLSPPLREDFFICPLGGDHRGDIDKHLSIKLFYLLIANILNTRIITY